MPLQERFTIAFNNILSLHPNKPPSPTELNSYLGRKPSKNIEGRLSKLRRELLYKNGFIKWDNGRWG